MQNEFPRHKIATLICNLLLFTITEEEINELSRWIEASDSNRHLFYELRDQQNIQMEIVARLN